MPRSAMGQNSTGAPDAHSQPACGASASAPAAWLPLRGELRLIPGPPTHQGGPSWTLHDPAAHRFFRVGWLEFEVLSRWRLGSAEAILRAIQNETTLNPHLSGVQAVHDFALRNNLVLASLPQDSVRLVQQKKPPVQAGGIKPCTGIFFYAFLSSRRMHG